MTFNSARIAALENHVANTKKQLAAFGAKALAGKPLTAFDHSRIEKARADLNTYSLRLQHEKSIAGTFGPRPH